MWQFPRKIVGSSLFIILWKAKPFCLVTVIVCPQYTQLVIALILPYLFRIIACCREVFKWMTQEVGWGQICCRVQMISASTLCESCSCPCCSLFPCSLFWKLLLAYPRIPATACPLTLRCHVSKSCCLWIHEWRGGQKQDEVVDYVPASRQEPHLTPIWFRDKASFQTWLWRVDKRRDLGDYTWQETFFGLHVVCDSPWHLFTYASFLSVCWSLGE